MAKPVNIRLPAPVGICTDRGLARKDQALYALNYVLGNGIARPRQGFVRFGPLGTETFPQPADLNAQRCRGFFSYTLSNGSRRWDTWHETETGGRNVIRYTMDGDRMSAETLGTAIDACDLNVPVSAVCFEDDILWCGPQASGKVYSGDVPLAAVNRDVPANTFVGQDPGPWGLDVPRARVLHVFQDRVLFLWQDTLFWSNRLDAHGHPLDNYAVLQAADVDHGCAMGDAGGALIIATNDYLWTMSGDFQTLARTIIRAPTHKGGCIAQGTWCRVDDGYMFLSEDGIRWTNGVDSVLLSMPIGAVFERHGNQYQRAMPGWSPLNRSLASYALATYWKQLGWYVFAYPSKPGDTAAANDLAAAYCDAMVVYDTKRKEWMGPWEIGPGISALGTVELADDEEILIVADTYGYHYSYGNSLVDEYSASGGGDGPGPVAIPVRISWHPVTTGDDDALMRSVKVNLLDDVETEVRVMVGGAEEDVDALPSQDTPTVCDAAQALGPLGTFTVGTTLLQEDHVSRQDLGLAGVGGKTVTVSIASKGSNPGVGLVNNAQGYAVEVSGVAMTRTR